jgi:hypothetical protein
MTFERTIPKMAAACVLAATSRKASPLPGETSVRRDLIDSAVRELNRIYVTKGLEAARGVGEHVLRTFFDGKVENFRRRGQKHVSFRKLAGRDDLRVSYGFIWKCVAFVDQLKALPSDLANALPVTHHTLLLPVHDEKTKVTLARKAVRENLTKRELAVEVRRIRKHKSNGGARRGRPPTLPIARLLHSFGRLATLARSKEMADSGDLHGLPLEKVRTMIGEAERHLATMHTLVERLRRHFDDVPAEMGHGSL